MAENVVGIDIVARLDAFKAELAKIPDIGAGEAKALTAQLSKEIKAAEKAAKDAAKASKDLAKGFTSAGNAAKRAADEVDEVAKATEKFGDHAGDTGSNAAKLAGILDRIAPGAGEAAIAVNDLADVGEVAAVVTGALGVSLGTMLAVALPIAVVVGGIALAWNAYSEEAKAAEEAQKNLLAALDDVGDISKSSRAEVDKLRVNLGQWTQAQYDDTQVNREWDERLQSGTEALKAHRDELIASADDIDSTTSARKKYAHDLNEVNALIADATTLNEQGRTAALANVEIARETAESNEVLKKRLEDKNEAERQGKESASKAAEAERKHALAMAEAAAQATAYRSALAGIEGITSKANASQLDGYEELKAARDDQFDAIVTQQQAAIEGSLGNDAALLEADTAAATARDAVWAQYYSKLTEYNQKQYDASAALNKKSEAEEAAMLARTEEASYATAAAVTGAVQAVAEAVQASAEEGTESQKKLALAAFHVSQGAAIASTIITTASAAMKAYSAALELGPPGLVLAPIAAAATAAVGAAQVATIASQPAPKFHRGLAPDEIPATLTRGEGVLTGQGVRAVGGPDAVRRANRGESSSQQIAVYQIYDHQVFNATVQDNIQMPTSPLRRAIRAGRRVGHRSRSN